MEVILIRREAKMAFPGKMLEIFFCEGSKKEKGIHLDWFNNFFS